MTVASVRLRPLRREDGPFLYEWIIDRDEAATNGPWLPVSELDHEQWFHSAMSRQSDRFIFAIEVAEENAPIGVCQLVSVNMIHRNAELRIRIGEEASRGRGYGTQAVRHLVEFAFADLGLHRVSLHVFATNLRALRAYEKAGFTREGVLKDGAWIRGQWVDVVVMSTLANDATWLTPYPQTD